MGLVSCYYYCWCFIVLLFVHLTHGADKGPRLLFANRKDIRLVDTGSRRGNTTIIVRDLIEATALDVNLQQGMICWSDIEAEKIQCQVNSKKTTLVWTSLPAPEDIALDTLTSKLYWTDSENNRIEIVCLETKLRKVIIWEDIDQPRAIVLDTNVRTMFWSDWGENPKIERASMDGNNRRVLIDKDIFWPNGIALDYRNKHLYWVDAKLHYIARVDYTGLNRKLINKDGPLHPFSLAYYRGVLYWSDWHTNSLHSIRLDTSQIRNLATKPNITPMDIVIYEEPDKPKEVNPCAAAGSKCSHICLLSESSRGFTCACPVGVKLLSETVCNNEIQEFLIVARGTDIRRISLDTTDYTDVLLGFTGIKHLLTVDYWNGTIFWTDDEARKIRMGSLTTFETTDVITEEIVHPDGLAIDWVGQNLYWTDAGTDRIEVSKLNGRFRKILVSRGLSEPRAVALDPAKGLMFWSDWGKKPRIERAFMDGSGREAIITENIFWPNGIAVDNGVLYWCDAKNDKIEVATYDGRNRRELITQDLPHTFGFSLLGDYVYWTDWQRRTVERAHKITGSDRIVIKELFTDPMGIVAVAPKRYNYTLNPCSRQIHECDHLCLFNGDFSKPSHCSCASGYELGSNNKSCTLPEAFILYSNNGEIHRVSLTQSRSDVIPVKGKSPSALDYDIYESRIYWTDSKFNSIFRAFMNGSDTERIIDYGIKHPEGLAIDWLNRNVYWTDMGRNRIEVARLNGSYRRTLLWDNIDSPRSIIVQPNKGWLYWSSWSNDNPGIEKCSLDGSKRIPLVSHIGRAYGLALDQDHLYWSDIDNYMIERLHLASGTRSVVVNGGQLYRPFSIATYQSWLYWQDTESGTILRLQTNGTVPATIEKVHSNIKTVQELKIWDKLKQSKATWTPCAVLNCSHLCFTVQHKSLQPVCSCPNHYMMINKGSTCVPPEDYILFSSTTSVSRFIDFDSIVLGGLRNVSQVGSDRNYLYVLSSSSGVLRRIRLDEQGGPPLSNIAIADGVRRFILYGHLVFYSTGDCINVSTVDGVYVGHIFCSPSLDEQVSHLKIYKEHLYYVISHRIERITLNGIGRTVVVNGTTTEPGGLEIEDDLIYWSEAERIFVANLLGINMKTLGGSNLGAPKDLAVMGRYVYWVDTGGGLERMDKWTGQERSRIVPRTENLTSIVHVDFETQNDCNKDCKICAGKECTCPVGEILAQDGKSCLVKQDCPIGYFKCAAGHIGCIAEVSRCNGISECQDSSDETGCFVCSGENCDAVHCKSGDCAAPLESSSFELAYLIVPVLLFLLLILAASIILIRRKKQKNRPSGSSTTGPMPLTASTTATSHLHHLHQYPLEPTSTQSIKYTNNSSSSSSNYNELLVPHPSPVTTTHSYCCSHSNSATGPGGASKKYYYLQQQQKELGPCPTPCSTDVCDNSDIYNFSFNAPPPSITSSPNSTLRMYIPPPPSPT